jgi:hypothetical protein
VSNYTLGFYRVHSPFADGTMRRTLGALDRLEMSFFPATLITSKTKSVVLEGAGDYARALLPREYFIDAQTATIPLEANNGVQIAFTESKEPNLVPASVLFQLTDTTLSANGWDLDDLVRISLAMVETFEPDYGYLFDDLHARRPEYKTRMFTFDRLMVPSGLFWVNYYGPTWVRNVGRERLEKLCTLLPLCRWLHNGGILFAIQSSPYREADPTQRAAQERLEALLGLQDVQSVFPNRGF